MRRTSATNAVLKAGIEELGLRHFEAAEILGIPRGTFSWRVNKPMPFMEQMKILDELRGKVMRNDGAL